MQNLQGVRTYFKEFDLQSYRQFGKLQKNIDTFWNEHTLTA